MLTYILACTSTVADSNRHQATSTAQEQTIVQKSSPETVTEIKEQAEHKSSKAQPLFMATTGLLVESIELQCPDQNYQLKELTNVTLTDASSAQNAKDLYIQANTKNWVVEEYASAACTLKFHPMLATYGSSSIVVSTKIGGNIDCVLPTDGSDVQCRCFGADCPPENGKWAEERFFLQASLRLKNLLPK